MPGASFVCGQDRARSWLFRSCPRWPSDGLPPTPASGWTCLWDTMWRKGQAAVSNIAADQKTSRPLPGKVIVVFAGVEIGQLKIDPVVPAWTFGPFAGRQAAPGLFGKALRDRGCGAGDRLLFAPGMEHVIGSNTQNITFACLAQQRLDFSRAIHAVRCHERERHLCGDCASNHSARDLGLRRKAHIGWYMRCLSGERIRPSIPLAGRAPGR